ncbi:MAG: type II toxin-antitoxin system RelE/ParE family toxin [Magnetospirillum sp.]|nr:type II toxin-antitoxin system RelE/ParE family toxin [Magnetospirillum sp.]
MHAVEYSKQATKALRRMPANIAATIRDKVLRIAEDPYAPHANATKLQNRDGYRLRVGDWRVVYRIDNGKLILLVVDIGPRGGIYQ